METVVLLSAKGGAGELPLPVMTIIAMLLLMLPYLIRRYTGRSVTDLFRIPVILGALDSLAEKLRHLLSGRFRKTDAEEGKQKNPRSVRKTRMQKADSADIKTQKEQYAGVRAQYREKTQEKQRAGNLKNDYLHALSRLLTFARKKQLFVIVPANLQHGQKVSDLAAILVTRERVIGIAAYGFGQTIVCRRDNGQWHLEDGGSGRAIGCLNAEVLAQDRIIRGSLRAHSLGSLPYETVMVFTGSDAVLTGERPENAYTFEEFLQSVDTRADGKAGGLDPKETGKKIAALKAGKKR